MALPHRRNREKLASSKIRLNRLAGIVLVPDLNVPSFAALSLSAQIDL
jgi:hypothetical protein